MPARRAPAAILAACLLSSAAAGCGTTQRCRITPWFEVEHHRRIQLWPGVAAVGEDGASARILAGSGWVEVERHRAASYHRSPNGVLLLVLDGPGGEAVEAHYYRQGSPRLESSFATANCPRPLVLAQQEALLCWICATIAATPEEDRGCATAAFARLNLDGTGRWERSLPIPVSSEGRPCHVEELYGLSGAGHPVVRIACPASESARWIDPWIRADVELRADGFAEVAPGSIPHPPASLPWVDARCPRWAPGP
jgi:hypothetical protein